MAFGVLMGQIAVIFLEVMLGYAGARCGVITDRDSRFLSDFIMKLLLPLDNVLRTGLMVIASCPAGSLAAVVAKQSGTEPALASQAVAHSTICMLVTVPVMLLLTGQLLPL